MRITIQHRTDLDPKIIVAISSTNDKWSEYKEYVFEHTNTQFRYTDYPRLCYPLLQRNTPNICLAFSIKEIYEAIHNFKVFEFREGYEVESILISYSIEHNINRNLISNLKQFLGGIGAD